MNQSIKIHIMSIPARVKDQQKILCIENLSVMGLLLFSLEFVDCSKALMNEDFCKNNRFDISLIIFFPCTIFIESLVEQGSLSSGKWSEKSESINFADVTFLVTYKYLERDDIQNAENSRPSPDDDTEEKERSEGTSMILYIGIHSAPLLINHPCTPTKYIVFQQR